MALRARTWTRPSGSPEPWIRDLRRVQQTVLKAGARVTEHGPRIVVDVAKAAGVLWSRVLGRVKRWWRDATWGGKGRRRRQ